MLTLIWTYMLPRQLYQLDKLLYRHIKIQLVTEKDPAGSSLQKTSAMDSFVIVYNHALSV